MGSLEDSALTQSICSTIICLDTEFTEFTLSRSARRAGRGNGGGRQLRVGSFELFLSVPRSCYLTPCSLAEDESVSSASLLVSPQGAGKSAGPLSASTPLPAAGRFNGGGAKEEVATSCNGLDQLDNRNRDSNKNYDNVGVGVKANGNIVNVNVVSESSNSIDVLSGGESDAGDTLSRSRRNNNSITSCVRDSMSEKCRKRGLGAQRSYLLARELLMTERTYKRDLELVTVTWSSRVSTLASSGTFADNEETIQALGRPCLALEPLALAQGAFLARLEKCLCAPTPSGMAGGAGKFPSQEDNEEPDFNQIPELLHDYLSNTYDEYMSYFCRAGVLVARLESARRGDARDAEAACSAFDASSPLPLACLLLRPLHRLLYYAPIANEVWALCGGGVARAANELGSHLAQAASEQLRHAENHAALCQLQRDIAGYEKLLVGDREFLRLGCLYKHSSKGLQQRMLFLFSDVMVLAWKVGGGGSGGGGGGGGAASRFRAHAVLPVCTLRLQACDLPHTFTLSDEESTLMLSASNEQEFAGWYADLERAIEHARRERPAAVDTELTPYEQHEEAITGCSDSGGGGGWCAGGGLAHVCWHRATSLSRDHMHLAMQTQLSGYLLRKFKNSHGWQKLWVVFAVFSLYFYKSWQDDKPLASLPLLGYSVGPPAETDAIKKDFVFKLQFKNHIYFFRADSHYTYDRWTETLQTTMLRFEN
ncbi:FERM, ARHGEF and pleckstrin domain-containing protein 2 [Eumeta japonica]|uniref:FERM, ARHGEF and pleckstrin domain-containing protein 2 n=1 Tax=Eumeta variegata TaxID=151549 RepID=A0A4C1TWZ5_EUMVA|nr:FERM, ARHGEF and pleckstrin domain-containing protein 2 [Eumeta japonica]